MIFPKPTVTLPTTQVIGAQTTLNPNAEVVLAKVNITNFQLFGVAGGQPQTFPFDNDLFGIRFVVKRSWKTKENRSAIEFEMQLVSKGVDNHVSKQAHVVKTRVETITKEKYVKPTVRNEMKLDLQVQEENAW